MSTFQDPFAGTPKAATKREIGIDNSSPLEKARRGTIFVENGLFGMRDTDGSLIYPPRYAYIGRCKDHVILLETDGQYTKLFPGGDESGYMQEEDRPYVLNGKVGFKEGDKVIIPPEYDYIRKTFLGNKVFTVTKDGREFYINDEGKEVLTRVRRFKGEDGRYSPFWLLTNQFDIVTVEGYVGHRDESNPNIVQIDEEWVELERYSRDEIMKMLIDPSDDLPLTEKDTALLCNDFSYEYSFYFANASGEKPLTQCFSQLERMKAFNNSWLFVTKIWLAPGEQLEAKELRDLDKSLRKQRILGKPLYAVGHSDKLNPGAVRMLFITHYNERCWPAEFEFEWSRKCKKLPITELAKQVPGLRKTVKTEVLDKYVKEVFHDQISDCLRNLKYFPGLDWDEVRRALDYFLKKGSELEGALQQFLSHSCLEDDTAFFLRAAHWALDRGADVNGHVHFNMGNSPLDELNTIILKFPEGEVNALAESLKDRLISLGAKTSGQLLAEREANTDYFRELEYLRTKS